MLIVILLIVSYIVWHYYFKYNKTLKSIPGPPDLPFVGSLFYMGKNSAGLVFFIFLRVDIYIIFILFLCKQKHLKICKNFGAKPVMINLNFQLDQN